MRIRRLLFLLVAAVLLLPGAAPAAGDGGEAPPRPGDKRDLAAADLSDPELRRLLSLLEDPERRTAFTKRLRALARARAATAPEAEKPAAEMLKAVAGGAEQVENVVKRVGGAVGEAPAFGQWLLEQLRDGGVLIAPLEDSGGRQWLTQVRRVGSVYEKRRLEPVRFVPLLQGVVN